MLNIFFGEMPEAIYNTDVYFNNTYEDEWITEPVSVEMIEAVDKSKVIGPRLIDSPVLGAIPAEKLSGGVKTLILINCDKSGKVFNASTCGDNCAKWILKIAEERDITINLHHMMDFGKKKFDIHILNNDTDAKSMSELIDSACDYVWGQNNEG